MMRICQRLKRVIVTPVVYPRFFEFLHVDIQSTGHTLSRPWSRQPNDVMSDIECTQLHSELFRRRHSTRHSHGLFALAKHLFVLHRTTSRQLKNMATISSPLYRGIFAPVITVPTVSCICSYRTRGITGEFCPFPRY